MTSQEQAAVATLRAHVARLLGVPVTGWCPVSGGWTVAVRGVAELAGGQTVFAKLGDIPGRPRPRHRRLARGVLCREGRPAPPAGAPRVRGFQRAQLEIALPWAAELLGLPPP